MKNIIVPVLGSLVFLLFACKSGSKETSEGQNKNYTITMDGIDSLKLGMSKAELEKILGTTLTFKHIGKDYSPDTINVKYKGMDMILYLEADYDTAKVFATLHDILTTDPSCKTEKGIGIGADKKTVIDAYEDYTRYVAPEYEVYPVRSATKSAIAVMDTAISSRALLFRIIDKKVVSVEVKTYHEFY